MDFNQKFDHRESEINFSTHQLTALLRRMNMPADGFISKLSGGYSNHNYLFESEGEKWVLRLSGKSTQEFLGEISILQHVSKRLPVPEIITFKTNDPELNRHITIMSFMPGVPLSQIEDKLSSHQIASIASSIGRWMATMHQISFSESGFFGPGCKIVETLSPFADQVYGYLQHFASNPHVVARLGEKNLNQLHQYIQVHQHLLKSLPNTTCLTHSDFNQKNILVHKIDDFWQVSAILDWEFAFSGCPLIDFGNFFRFEDELSPHYKQPLIQAYQENGGILGDNWQKQSHYLDLLSMLDFLSRDGDFPRTVATAKKIITSRYITN